MKKNFKTGPSFLFGFHAVREAWLNPERSVKALYVLENAAAGFEKTLQEARENGLRRPQPILKDKKTFDKMAPFGAVHQGLLLDCEPLDDRAVQDLTVLASQKDKSVLVMLDQVTDPHNVGAILRSASAFGADGLILQKKHAPALYGVLAKTACGALEHCPVAQETNLSRTLEFLKDHGFTTIGLDERGEQTILEFRSGVKNNADDKICIVLGAEGPGLRPLVRDHCDVLVKLPTQGAIQSLNVSNAAAVALYACL